ncbi:hypothetical protein ACFYWU_41245 [Streptomyces chrestomyceticus]|uniref:hypothetical protein n=1 Tax=Streptomyces chrestomyceticus TaxID=68185 RepID=UPI0036BCD41B
MNNRRPRRPPSVFDAAVDSCHPPLARADAFEAEVSAAAVTAVAVSHRIEPWIARLLLRPILADLTNRERWTHSPTGFVVRGSETARKDSPLCHAIAIDASRRRILAYQAGHAAAVCRRPTGRPPLDTTAWLSSACPPPAPGRDAVWRYLLRTSSCCPALLTGPALRAFAREQGQDLTHDTLPRTYRTAAACLHPIASLLPRARGDWALTDGTRRWYLRLKDGAAKPVITDVRVQPTVTGPHIARLLSPAAQLQARTG